MNRKLIGGVSAITLATVGTIALVAFVQGAEHRAQAGERLVEVLVVKDTIDAGTAASEADDRVRIERVPAKVRLEDAVRTLSSLGTKVADVDLLPGEQVTAARFTEPRDFERRRGEVDLDEGSLEVTISLAPERAVGGQLAPGSRVAVVASFDPFEISSTQPVQLEGIEIPQEGKTPNSTHIIRHKVLVTSVQAGSTPEPATDEGDEGEPLATPAPAGSLLVTLALDAPSVERVVFAAEHGRIWLAIEPEEASEEGTGVQTRGTVYQ